MSKKPQLYKFKDIENRLHTLEFSGNKAINLLVENIEVFLTDIGDPWVTNKKPDHNNE